MTTYTLSFAKALKHVPLFPDRTAYRSGETMDITFREWPSRGAMLESIRMQGRRIRRSNDWIDWLTSSMAARLCSCEGPDSTGISLTCNRHKSSN